MLCQSQTLRAVHLSVFRSRLNRHGHNYSAQLCFMKDEVFFSKVGITRKTFEDLLSRISEKILASSSRNVQDIALRIRLLMTVIYLTSKKVYKDIHDLFGYSEAAVCRLVYKTVLEINMLSADCIKWPSDLEAVSSEFFKVANLPGVIGCIDAMHLVARAPEKFHDEFRNSKGKYTLILLATCDHSKKFTFVSVGYPGHYTHTMCFDLTDIGQCVDVIPNIYFPMKKYHIVGNEHFHLKEGLLVPYRDHEIQSEDQIEFNKRLLATHETLSTTMSEMKSRFQTLNKLDMSIGRVVEFTTACCVIHNVCVDNGDSWTQEETGIDDEELTAFIEDPSLTELKVSSVAVAKRELIKDQLYLGLNYA